MDETVLRILVYASAAAACFAVISAYLWRLTVDLPSTEKVVLRSGLVGSLLVAGTLGTAEAAFLGFDPIALVAAAFLGTIGFGLGAALGAVVLAVARATRLMP